MAIIPFDDRDGVIWMDGKVIPWRDAKIHVLSHGLHYGSCVFEGERAYDGVIFKTTEHSIRFRKSAEIMDFEIPFSVEELNAAKDKVVALNGGGDQYVRPVAWRGSEMMAVSAQNNKIHVAIATWAWPSMFDPGPSGCRQFPPGTHRAHGRRVFVFTSGETRKHHEPASRCSGGSLSATVGGRSAVVT